MAIWNKASLGKYQREPLQNHPFTQMPSVYHALGAEDTWVEAGRCLISLVEEAATSGWRGNLGAGPPRRPAWAVAL